jgi:alkaline phosphatase D
MIQITYLFTRPNLLLLCKIAAIAFLVVGNTFLLLSSSSSSSSMLYGQQTNNDNNNGTLRITHGIASGDITNNSAVIWSRVNDQKAQMNVEYDTNANFTNPLNKTSTISTTQANSTTDFTAHLKLDSLKPDTQYYYKVWFKAPSKNNNINSSMTSNTEIGTFKTAPNSNVSSSSSNGSSNSSSNPISFVWGGDLGGQNYCRNAKNGGYSIFKSMQSLKPDFFIANGDMIYADGTCPVQGPVINNDNNQNTTTWTNIAGDFKSISDPSVDWNNTTEVRSIYLDHWKYNRNDTYFKEFLKNTPMYSQWDDHEIINDFGSQWPYWNLFNVDREGYPNIVKQGTEAFFYYSPISRNNDDTGNVLDNRIYRSFNWGKDLDLFITDSRSYRSQNHIADTPYDNKTMLGNEQLQWLKQKLSNSKATWKVISNDIPISIPTASNASILGRDGWANGNETNNYSYYTGFERELADLLQFIDEQNIKNIIFITTDVHFPAFIRYNFDLNNDDGNATEIYELISGPLNAVRGGDPFPKLDPTFNPSLLYGEGNIFNFGYVKIEKREGGGGATVAENGKPHFIAEIRDENGVVRPGSLLDLTPE